jgi:hypothetical protein
MAAEYSSRPARPFSACFSTNKRFFLSASGEVHPWATATGQPLAHAHVMCLGGGL